MGLLIMDPERVSIQSHKELFQGPETAKVEEPQAPNLEHCSASFITSYPYILLVDIYLFSCLPLSLSLSTFVCVHVHAYTYIYIKSGSPANPTPCTAHPTHYTLNPTSSKGAPTTNPKS